jgi:hypothetical protein
MNTEVAKFCVSCGKKLEAPQDKQKNEDEVFQPSGGQKMDIPPLIQKPIKEKVDFLDIWINKYSTVLGVLIMISFFLPWGNIAIRGEFTAKQFEFIQDANTVLARILNDVWYEEDSLFGFLLLFIPMSAASLFLWKNQKRGSYFLALVFFCLGLLGILTLENNNHYHWMGGSLFSAFGLIEWVCFILLIIGVLFSIKKISAQNNFDTPKRSINNDSLPVALGFLLVFLYFLPIKIFPDRSGSEAFQSILNYHFLFVIGDTPSFILEELGLRYYLRFILDLPLLSILFLAVGSILFSNNNRKSYRFVQVFSIIAFLSYILTVDFPVLREVFLITGGFPSMRLIFHPYRSVFYILQLLIIIFLGVYSSWKLSRKPVAAKP